MSEKQIADKRRIFDETDIFSMEILSYGRFFLFPFFVSRTEVEWQIWGRTSLVVFHEFILNNKSVWEFFFHECKLFCVVLDILDDEAVLDDSRGQQRG